MTQTESLHIPSVLEVPGTPEIYLAATAYDDAPELHRVLTQERKRLEEYQWWVQGIHTMYDTKRHNDAAVALVQAGEWLQYRIKPGASSEGSDQIEGTVTIYNHDSETHSAEFGYWLVGGAEGKGYARRSTEALLDCGKQVLGLTTVRARIAAGNERSERLAERLGCVLTGESYNHPVRREGVSRDFKVRVWSKDL